MNEQSYIEKANWAADKLNESMESHEKEQKQALASVVKDFGKAQKDTEKLVKKISFVFERLSQLFSAAKAESNAEQCAQILFDMETLKAGLEKSI